MSKTEAAVSQRTNWPVVLCWIAVALDGFDLVVLGAVIPTLTAESALGFTATSLRDVATIGLVGVGIGAVLVGPLTDRFGRRRSLIASIAIFSVFTLLIAFAPSITVFAILRFVAGLGLGACLPTALAFMTDHAPTDRAGWSVTRMMTGYHVGAVLTALLAIWLIPWLGWESMFVVGGLLGLATLPVMWARLPESQAYLALEESPELKNRTTTTSVKEVLSRRFLRASVGLWIASFMGLLLVYGLNTWLPTIMRAAGYSTGDSLALLVTLNLGAVSGLLVAGRLSDLRGNKPITLAWFAAAAVFLAVLSVKMQMVAALYAVVFLAGVFVFSAQVLVYAYVGRIYPASARVTAIGFSAGVGRGGAILGPYLGGSLVAAGIAYPWGFYVFAIAAALAVVAVSFVPTKVMADDSERVA